MPADAASALPPMRGTSPSRLSSLSASFRSRVKHGGNERDRERQREEEHPPVR